MNLKSILNRPIPDQSFARSIKPGYRDYPLLADGPRADEPLVDIELYGIAGQSYYSRPNAATGEALAGVSPAILVRSGVAERLAEINYALQESREMRSLFGRPVELYIDEGYRSPELQRKLYEFVFPQLIRMAHPDWSTSQVLARRDDLSAKPSTILATEITRTSKTAARASKDVTTPPPHGTGAAIDIRLRYQHPNLGYQPGSEIDMGHADADISHRADPDYYELLKPAEFTDSPKTMALARRNRRIFYWVMRGALIGDDSGLVVNPTEWWHWSHGDQLWAQLTQAPEAFYGHSDFGSEQS